MGRGGSYMMWVPCWWSLRRKEEWDKEREAPEAGVAWEQAGVAWEQAGVAWEQAREGRGKVGWEQAREGWGKVGWKQAEEGGGGKVGWERKVGWEPAEEGGKLDENQQKKEEPQLATPAKLPKFWKALISSGVAWFPSSTSSPSSILSTTTMFVPISWCTTASNGFASSLGSLGMGPMSSHMPASSSSLPMLSSLPMPESSSMPSPEGQRGSTKNGEASSLTFIWPAKRNDTSFETSPSTQGKTLKSCRQSPKLTPWGSPLSRLRSSPLKITHVTSLALGSSSSPVQVWFSGPCRQFTWQMENNILQHEKISIFTSNWGCAWKQTTLITRGACMHLPPMTSLHGMEPGGQSLPLIYESNLFARAWWWRGLIGPFGINWSWSGDLYENNFFAWGWWKGAPWLLWLLWHQLVWPRSKASIASSRLDNGFYIVA